MNIRLVVSLVLAGLVVLFVLQNAAVVEVRYFSWKVEVPRALLIFVVLAVGILIGWLLRAHQTRQRARGAPEVSDVPHGSSRPPREAAGRPSPRDAGRDAGGGAASERS